MLQATCSLFILAYMNRYMNWSGMCIYFFKLSPRYQVYRKVEILESKGDGLNYSKCMIFMRVYGRSTFLEAIKG